MIKSIGQEIVIKRTTYCPQLLRVRGKHTITEIYGDSTRVGRGREGVGDCGQEHLCFIQEESEDTDLRVSGSDYCISL